MTYENRHSNQRCGSPVPTFLFSFTEDGVTVCDGQQSDVLVVNNVLRVLEAVVSAQEVVGCRRIAVTEFVEEHNIEDLS